MLTDSEGETISRWIIFADYCTKHEKLVDFEEEGKQAQLLKLWLETLLAGLFDIYKKFGKQIATQICDLAQPPNCLYPSKMPQVAEYFQNGGSPLDITELIENGTLESSGPFFLKLYFQTTDDSLCASID